jgi:RNA recognition motif-containing protein
MRRNNNINGFALIEFNSNKTAKYFIKEYNNKKINGHLFCLNWAKNNYNKNNKENKEKEISNSDNQNNKYFTVSNNISKNIFLYIDIRREFRYFNRRTRTNKMFSKNI